ncbi:MAG: antitoxin [Micropruina sp.]
MEIFEQIKDAAAGHEDQISAGIDKLGDFVDEKTGGQYAGQVDQAQDFLRDQLGKAASAAK